LDAGRWFERIFDDAALDGHAAIDLRRARVDGSARWSSVAERKIEAGAELLALKAVLGEIDFGILSRVLGTAGVVDASSKDERRYVMRRIRDGLGKLAERRVAETVLDRRSRTSLTGTHSPA
jgi:hypothetical protein